MAFQKTNKFRKMSFFLWPVKDALTNNYQATPFTILQRLSSSHRNMWTIHTRRLEAAKG
jgi:hypothetical protein